MSDSNAQLIDDVFHGCVRIAPEFHRTLLAYPEL